MFGAGAGPVGTAVGVSRRFDLEAAEAVCSDGDPVLDLLDRLVSKSLLAVDRSAEVLRTEVLRYSQLMTVREYGADLSARRAVDLQRRHRDHYLDRTRCAPPHGAVRDSRSCWRSGESTMRI